MSNEHPRALPLPDRMSSLDALRGGGILGVLFLHFALYNYSGLLEIDFDNPPLIITIIGFLLTWAGLFAVISGTVYAFSSYRRVLSGALTPSSLFRSLLTAGIVLLAIHYVYFLLLGPTLLDLEAGMHKYSFLVGMIVTGKAVAPAFERVFYNTSLSMMAWNLILTAPLLLLLLRGEGRRKLRRNRWILLGISAGVLLLSAVRIPTFPFIESAIEQRNPFAMLLAGIFINKNDPVLPYLGFGLIGTAFGLSIAGGSSRRSLAVTFNLVALFWTAVGIIGLFALPDTMLERSVDFYWFFLVLFQCGFFSFIVINAVLLFDLSDRRRRREKYGRPGVFKFLGMVSLTLFLIESPVSALLARFWALFVPGWNASIPVLLGLGTVNLLFYGAVLLLWKRFGFRYSAEWLVAALHRKLGRDSGKFTVISESLTRK